MLSTVIVALLALTAAGFVSGVVYCHRLAARRPLTPDEAREVRRDMQAW